MSCYCGTSGWSYKQWENGTIPSKKSFYKDKSNFGEYAEHFNMVEVNSTFYKVPSPSTVVKWKRDAPKGFKYLVKVNKYLTHAKKLNDWNDLFEDFHTTMNNLGETLLGYLIQLPPQMSVKTLPRVVEMAKYNKRTFPNIDFYIEFRHRTWFCTQVYESLAGLMNIVFVNQYGVTKEMEMGFSPSLDDFQLVKNEKTMFRCHGTWKSQPYCGNYSDEELVTIASLAPWIVTFDNTDSFEYQLEVDIPGKGAFASQVVFVDTILPSAIVDAKRMRKML